MEIDERLAKVLNPELSDEMKEELRQVVIRAKHLNGEWPTREEMEYYDKLYAEPDFFVDDEVKEKETSEDLIVMTEFELMNANEHLADLAIVEDSIEINRRIKEIIQLTEKKYNIN